MQVPKKKKTIVEKYETLWNGGKSVTQTQPKVGYLITLYCVTKMNEDASKNPNLPQEEKLFYLLKREFGFSLKNFRRRT